MVTVDELQARVASGYDRLELPSWPDPRPDMAAPREEEYSRVTDPERYRVVHARARVWAAVLQDAVGSRPEPLTSASAARGDQPFDRGVRLVPHRPDALPLLLLERDVATRVGDAPLAVLDICVVRPDILVGRQPDCGCDACDSGSSDLLDAVDATIRDVVGGPYVVLRGRTWSAQWHPEGGQASTQGRGPHVDEVLDLCRRLADGETVRLPRGAEAFVGRSWLS